MNGIEFVVYPFGRKNSCPTVKFLFILQRDFLVENKF